MAPLFMAIALAIKITDGGPVFSRETRIGKDRQPFALLKFRTMAVGTETPQKLMPQGGLLSLVFYDPHVTRVGSWLRRYSLDELPQILNVLLGDMSLVGPRPALPGDKYGEYLRPRLAIKPGLTGLWQVSGRADLSWDEAVRLDVRYAKYWSLALDVQILWKTYLAVIRGHGAY
jgi:lipopolysaccharide/colanic/teichoic acid biosynthesis glycosyltransferase